MAGQSTDENVVLQDLTPSGPLQTPSGFTVIERVRELNAQRAGHLNLIPLGLLIPLSLTDYWLVTYYRSKLSHWRG
jgi:hypothetical protein